MWVLATSVWYCLAWLTYQIEICRDWYTSADRPLPDVRSIQSLPRLHRFFICLAGQCDSRHAQSEIAECNWPANRLRSIQIDTDCSDWQAGCRSIWVRPDWSRLPKIDLPTNVWSVEVDSQYVSWLAVWNLSTSIRIAQSDRSGPVNLNSTQSESVVTYILCQSG